MLILDTSSVLYCTTRPSYINLVFDMSLCKLEPKLHKKERERLFFLVF